MGNLLPLDISIDEGRADTKKLGGSFDVDGPFKRSRAVVVNCDCRARHGVWFPRGTSDQRLNLYGTKGVLRDGWRFSPGIALRNAIRRFRKLPRNFGMFQKNSTVAGVSEDFSCLPDFLARTAAVEAIPAAKTGRGT